MRCFPERGRIGIFNRSYYEETLVVRVHPELLARQRIPPALVTKSIWKERFEDINAVERYLARNGVTVLKFFLHISKEEQRKRFLKRLEVRERNWKFSVNDMPERQYWSASWMPMRTWSGTPPRRTLPGTWSPPTTVVRAHDGGRGYRGHAWKNSS